MRLSVAAIAEIFRDFVLENESSMTFARHVHKIKLHIGSSFYDLYLLRTNNHNIPLLKKIKRV
jgi:hypothetical protein